jgi:hypothetical protein
MAPQRYHNFNTMPLKVKERMTSLNVPIPYKSRPIAQINKYEVRLCKYRLKTETAKANVTRVDM